MFLWLAECTAVLGFSMFQITISWYVADELHLAQYLGLLLAASAIPRVILMVFGGLIADKIQKSRIMFVTNLCQAILLGVLLFIYINEALTFTVLLVITFLFGSLDAFLFPALTSLIPSLVKKEQLQSANALINGSSEFFFMIGPLIAGILLTWFSFSMTFSMAALSVLLSAVFVIPPFIGDKKPEKTDIKEGMIEELREGISYIWKSPVHKTGSLVIVIVNLFVFGPMFISFPIIVSEMGKTAFHLSLLESSFAIGSLSATILLFFITLREKRGKWVLIFLMVTIIASALFGQIESSFSLLIGLATLIGLGGFLTYLPVNVMIQEKTDPDKLGRVMSIVFLASSGFDPLAFALVSFLMTAGLSIHTLITVMSLIGFLSAILITVKGKHFRTVE